MNPRLAAALRYLIGLALGAVLLYLAFDNVSWNEVRQTIFQVHPGFLAASLAVNLYSHWLRAWRWNMLLEANDQRVPTSHSFAAVLFGYMVNYAVPRLGEVSRCTILLRSDRVPLVTSGGTVVTERAIDVLMLLAFVGVVFLLEFDRLLAVLAPVFAARGGASAFNWFWLALPAALALAAAALLYVFRARWQDHRLAQAALRLLSGLWRAASSVFRLRKPWLFALLSLLIWAGYTLSSWLAMQALPVTQGLSLYLAFVIMAMGGIGMAIPSPGGVGSFHSAITYTFVMFGLPQASGVALGLLIHTPQLLVVSVSGGISYFYLALKSRRAGKAEA